MKRLIVATLIAVATVGCSSKRPKADLIVEKELHPMTRDQVIMAIRECEQAETRPVVSKAPVRVAGALAHVVIDVTCSPRYAK